MGYSLEDEPQRRPAVPSAKPQASGPRFGKWLDTLPYAFWLTGALMLATKDVGGAISLALMLVVYASWVIYTEAELLKTQKKASGPDDDSRFLKSL